jgi:hypothetical protein
MKWRAMSARPQPEEHGRAGAVRQVVQNHQGDAGQPRVVARNAMRGDNIKSLLEGVFRFTVIKE